MQSIFNIEGKDLILVFSVNGEKIIEKEIDMKINSFYMSETGYQFLIGTDDAKLYQVDLLSLQFWNLLEDENDLDNKNKVAIKCVKDSITAMTITHRTKSEKLIIGTKSGNLFMYKRKRIKPNTK